jgi:hypothetical protein
LAAAECKRKNGVEARLPSTPFERLAIAPRDAVRTAPSLVAERA